MEMVARAETEVEGTAVVRGGIKAGKEQVRAGGVWLAVSHNQLKLKSTSAVGNVD